MLPRLDVLLPVRLARRTLPWAVRDVLAQRGVAVRLLAVVDAGPGGTDDGSRAWIEALARHDRRVQVLAGPGRGVGAALDVALQQADAPLVAHMEADDRCDPGRLALQAAALAADPALDGVTCRVAQFGARTAGMRRYLDWQNALLGHAAMSAARFLEIPALHQTGVYRAAALRDLGGYAPRGPWPADIDAWLRWFEHDALVAPRRVAKLPRVLYRWRQHAAQSTRGGGTHAPAALRACKLHYLARLHGRHGARPRPVLLLSTGATLATWRAELPAAGLELAGAEDWKPGRPAPRVPPGALVLAVYGMQPARARLRAALGAPREPDELLFAG